MRVTEISWGQRIISGILAGIIGAVVAGIILALFGFGGLFILTAGTAWGIVLGSAVIGLIYSLIVLPSDWASSTWKGLILGLIAYLVFALARPIVLLIPVLFSGVAVLSAFTLFSLVTFLLMGLITSLAYSVIGRALVGTTVRTTERPIGQTGGERKVEKKESKEEEES